MPGRAGGFSPKTEAVAFICGYGRFNESDWAVRLGCGNAFIGYEENGKGMDGKGMSLTDS